MKNFNFFLRGNGYFAIQSYFLIALLVFIDAMEASGRDGSIGAGGGGFRFFALQIELVLGSC